MRPRTTTAYLASFCLLGAGCWRENPVFGADGSEPGSTGVSSSSSGGATSSGELVTSSSSATTTSDGSGGASATAGGSTEHAVTSDVPIDSSGDGETGWTGSSTSTGTDTTSGSTGEPPDMCVLGDAGEPPRLEVRKNGELLLACGGAKTFTDAFAKFSGSTLQIYDSGTCTQSGNLYEVKGVGFTIAPMEFGEECSAARIEWAPTPPCEVTGFGLANGDAPTYVGGFGRTVGPVGFEDFAAEPVFDCGCAVDGATCCEHLLELDQSVYSPGRYVLGFPGAGEDIGPDSSITGTLDGNDYLFTNLRSFVREECAPVPAHVWLDVRWWATSAN